MKLRNLSIITLLIALVCMIAVPDYSYARKRSSKAKTTATTSKKGSKKSKKSRYRKSGKSQSKKSTTRRRSYGGGSAYAGNTASDHEIERIAAQYSSRPLPTQSSAASTASAATRDAVAASSGKRKIKVVKPDLEQIRTVTLDPTSKFYFPKLRKKYEVNDTTMTPEEFRYFYLGYMFQEDFDPYRVSPYSAKTEALRNKPTHTKAEIDTISKYAELALQDNPFDLQQMSFLVHVFKESKKFIRAKIWEYRLENLLGAIKSTGTGETQEDAWYVMYPVHEYDMVQLLGYEPVDAKFIDGGYDYLEVQPDPSDTRKRDKSAKGFYFNVMVPQEQYELKHPEEVSMTQGADLTAPSISVKEELEEIDPDDLPAQ